MRLLVIGGTRGCGREVVVQGSARGHDMTLLARQANAAPPAPRLTVVEGDACDVASVRAAMQGQDAVLLCVGMPLRRGPVRLFSDAAKAVLAAMRECGVERLLYVSSVGVGDSRGHAGFWFNRVLQRLLLRDLFDDKTRAEILIAASTQRWTICRPGRLTNGTSLARYRILTRLELLPSFRAGPIARADVAHFLLEEVERNEFVRTAPIVCY